jgi:hypothetical protein
MNYLILPTKFAHFGNLHARNDISKIITINIEKPTAKKKKTPRSLMSAI